MNLEFPKERIPWPSDGLRRASVNSFGFGGSNAHAILDDACSALQAHGLEAHHTTAPKVSAPVPIQDESYSNSSYHPNGITEEKNANGQMCPLQHESECGGYVHNATATNKLLVWTAADKEALIRVISDYASHYSRNLDSVSKEKEHLHHLAYTLSLRRTRHAWRNFAVIPSAGNLPLLSQLAVAPVRVDKEGGIVFVFTGQGAQYADMGKDLMQWPLFKETLIEFDNIMRGLGCQWSVFSKLSLLA